MNFPAYCPSGTADKGQHIPPSSLGLWLIPCSAVRFDFGVGLYNDVFRYCQVDAVSSIIDYLILIHCLGTCNIVRDPLKYAGAVLRRRPALCPQGEQLETDPVLGLRIKWTHPDLDPTELKPDWAVYDRKVQKSYYSAADKDGNKPLAFAIGDSKMCQKWKSDWIHSSLATGHIDLDPARTASGRQLQKTHRVTVERLRPLEQLATYCRFGETRYGFILTQEELVAFRIRRLDPALIVTGPLGTGPVKDKPYAGIEYKSIPWHASGPGKLTANLAIWALGCMGMNDHHRIMETSGGELLDSMVRLTKWTYEDKRNVYRNDISGREITEEGWKKLGTAVAFVKLDDKKGGASYTSTFASRDGIASITQGVEAVNLSTPTSRGRTPAQDAAKQPKYADQGAASSSKPAPGATSPPQKFTIAGKKGAPAYEMGMSNGKKVLKMEIPVEMDTKKKQYYYIDPETKDKVYLVQV